jgi:ABC-type multidrug transport system fused ATPase/permease subunit
VFSVRPLPLPHPGPAPLTSPEALLWWLARRQSPLLVASIACGIVANAAAAAMPYVLGRIIDSGLADGLNRSLWLGCAEFGAVGLVQVGSNVWGHRLDIENWLRAAFTTSQLIGHHVTRTGDAVTAELPTGEVVSTVASDALRVGEVFALAARLIGGLVAYAGVVVMLMLTSITLGMLALLGLPVVVSAIALLVRPLQRRQAAQREASGRLTTLGADTVSGLRILRGIGGEDVFAGRYRAQSEIVRRAGVGVAETQSLLDALQTLLPGLLVTAVVWVGAHLALAHEITPGQLVSFYGFAAFLTQPLWTATETARVMTRALVGCRKIIRVLQVPEAGADSAARRAGGAAASPATTDVLVDERCGLVVRPGSLVAVVSADPDESARLAARLGRFRPAPGNPWRDGAGERPADDEALSDVRWGSALLRELHLREVRDRIVVAESTPHLFTGMLADELDVRGRADEADLLRALHVADAADVLDSIPGGLAGAVEEKGRSLSGGQRQRVALARALLTEAEVLVLVEPTSAVDAHTEARIARRLAEARRGRTTVLVTASPLVLDVVEEVVLLEDGRVRARGSHRELLASTDPAGQAYRAVVARGQEPTTDEERTEEHREAARR